MPPKGGNAKKESGRAKKAENELKKKEVAEAEKGKKEALDWEDGSKNKSSKDDKEEKRKADLARKAENARLLAEEEASAPTKPKPAPKAGKKKVKEAKPAGPGAIAAGERIGGGAGDAEGAKEGDRDEPESFSATGLEDALEMMQLVTAKTDKVSVGQQAAGIEKHPERRFKAAFEAYLERELPNAKVDHPGLRLQQYKDVLFKQFQKSPDNPFNQLTVTYDASKEEKLDILKQKRTQAEERHREKKGEQVVERISIKIK